MEPFRLTEGGHHIIIAPEEMPFGRGGEGDVRRAMVTTAHTTPPPRQQFMGRLVALQHVPVVLKTPHFKRIREDTDMRAVINSHNGNTDMIVEMHHALEEVALAHGEIPPVPRILRVVTQPYKLKGESIEVKGVIMDPIPGKTVSELIREKAFDTALTIEFAGHFLHELEYFEMTKKAIVINDIKPSNVIFNTSPKNNLEARFPVRIIDLGTAKYANAPHKEGHLNNGTLYWMAPEQAAGSACDQRTNVLQAALTMLEVLTGKFKSSVEDRTTQYTRVYRYDDVSKTISVLLEEAIKLAPPVELPLVAALANVITIATAYDPKDRYQSVAAMREDFQARVDLARQKQRARWSRLPTEILVA